VSEHRIELCESPIFVIGSPRSGTTILAIALAQHSELWTSDESAYLFQLLGSDRIANKLEQARAQPSPSWIRTQGVSDDEFFAYLGLGLNALYTNRSGGKRWIDTTPLNTLMIGDLARLFPGALFLHILRDGREVVHSMLHFLDVFDEGRQEEMAAHIGAWSTDFREACRSWVRYVDAASAFAARHPERSLTIRHEQLAHSPAEEFRRIFDFLELPHEDGPAEYFAAYRINSSFGADGAGASAWESWSGEEREVFEEEAGAAMANSGLT
jgi:sulfotransferase family protein